MEKTAKRRGWAAFFASLWLLTSGVASAAAQDAPAPDREETVVLSVGSSGGGGGIRQLDCPDGSRIEFVRFEDGILGSDPELIRACQNGAISMYQGVISGAAEVVPEAALLDIPYLADSLEDYRSICEGPILDWLQPYFHAQNLHLLTLEVASFRGVFASGPVRTPEELSALRLRTMEDRWHDIFWNSLGVRTFTVSFDQLEYALRQKRINAAELPFDSVGMLSGEGLFPCFIATDHLPALRTKILNLDVYNSLTECQRQSLATFSRADTAPAEPLSGDRERNVSVEILAPDEELKDFLRQGRSAVIEQLKLELGEQLVEEFLLRVNPREPVDPVGAEPGGNQEIVH